MKVLVIASAISAIALSGCSSLGVDPSTATAANQSLTAFLTDPNCAHHDEATFVTGAAGVPASFQAKVVRDCAAKGTVSASTTP